MRAREPDRAGTVEVDGLTIAWEAFGERGPVIVLMPTWCVVHARIWKLQVPYLSRHFRVIAWDGPGNGGSSRPADPAAYSAAAHVRYALAVLEAAGVRRATLVASSGGTHRTLTLAAGHPDLVEGICFVGPDSHLAPTGGYEVAAPMAAGDLPAFLQAFMGLAFTEPHSTKAVEDGIGWGSETSLAVLAAALAGDRPAGEDAIRALCAQVTCPVLIVQGTDDRLTPPVHGERLAEAIGERASLVLIEGGGHRTDVRDPVRFSLLLRAFAGEAAPPAGRWTRAASRPPRALYLSSPIGLGHARRDVAIARELRAIVPELEISWLAQDPVTRVLAEAGEAVHPASRWLAGESAHIASQASGHRLHVFEAWRRMDEILAANFMVLHDVLEAEPYDLVIGDEAWEADHFLHENPELKRGAFAWLTDFVGWLPVTGDVREAALTADYNAEMVEHVARSPWVRDRALFLGDPGDVVDLPLGPGLPGIREWTTEHFAFTGHVTGFDPGEDGGDAARAQFGLAPGEPLCVAAVGGSGVGSALLEAVIAAFAPARELVPGLRMIAVAGPRVDPARLGAGPDGLTVTGYVPGLHRLLAACDVAVVQAGLTTAMELVATGRPFIYVPLDDHFEQQVHVPHRLDRHRAGRRMAFADATPERLAEAIAAELGREVDYLPVPSDGAARAAGLIAELLG
jgi:pimeloyl-ACP methyl ester carboxylesterase/predicted glycosyltransferase